MNSLRARPVVRRNSLRRGLTLIELVVVVAILAVLAMLLAPRLAFLRTMSLHAGAGTSIQDVMQNMLTYHASQAKWPDRFDSLLNSADSLYGSVSTTYGLDSNLRAVLTTTQLTANQAKSLSGLIGQSGVGGVTTMEYIVHDETFPKPGNSGITVSTLTTGDTVAVINITHNVLTLTSDQNAASGNLIMKTVYPDGVNGPNGDDIIVAMGVGPLNRAVSKTIVTPPQLYMKDATRYNRVVVLFRVPANGVQASLAGAISSDGRTLDQCLGNYRTTAER